MIEKTRKEREHQKMLLARKVSWVFVFVSCDCHVIELDGGRTEETRGVQEGKGEEDER